MAEYDEDAHPRDEQGRFTSGGGGGAGEAPKARELREAREKLAETAKEVRDVPREASHAEHQAALDKLEAAHRESSVTTSFDESQTHNDEYRALNRARSDVRSRIDTLRMRTMQAKQREAKAAQSDIMKWADSKLEPHDLKENAIGVRGGTEKGSSKWYSFDEHASAAHAGKITLDQETMSKIASAGTRDGAKMVRELSKKIDVPPGHMVVYRVGSKDVKGLGSRNAANAAGIADFLSDSFERGVGHGDTLHAYVVKKPKSFGSYTELTGGKQRGK